MRSTPCTGTRSSRQCPVRPGAKLSTLLRAKKPTGPRRTAARPDAARAGCLAAAPGGREAPPRHYICPVPASTASPLFDDFRFVDDPKPRLDGAQPPAVHAINRDRTARYRGVGQTLRTQQAHRGGGDAAIDQPARTPQAPCPGTSGAATPSPWRIRRFPKARTGPEFLAQPVRETASAHDSIPANGGRA